MLNQPCPDDWTLDDAIYEADVLINQMYNSLGTRDKRANDTRYYIIILY
jgi:hypothetical protein